MHLAGATTRQLTSLVRKRVAKPYDQLWVVRLDGFTPYAEALELQQRAIALKRADQSVQGIAFMLVWPL